VGGGKGGKKIRLRGGMGGCQSIYLLHVGDVRKKGKVKGRKASKLNKNNNATTGVSAGVYNRTGRKT